MLADDSNYILINKKANPPNSIFTLQKQWPLTRHSFPIFRELQEDAEQLEASADFSMLTAVTGLC